jgi:hypothetical protein
LDSDRAKGTSRVAISALALVVLLIIAIAAITASGMLSTTGDCTVGGHAWNHARLHIGEQATVWGPVVGATLANETDGEAVYLNFGTERPESRPDAFVVVIREENRHNFPEPPEHYYVGKTVCVDGLIVEVGRVGRIEVSNPSQIRELEASP